MKFRSVAEAVQELDKVREHAAELQNLIGLHLASLQSVVNQNNRLVRRIAELESERDTLRARAEVPR